MRGSIGRLLLMPLRMSLPVALGVLSLAAASCGGPDSAPAPVPPADERPVDPYNSYDKGLQKELLGARFYANPFWSDHRDFAAAIKMLKDERVGPQMRRDLLAIAESDAPADRYRGPNFAYFLLRAGYPGARERTITLAASDDAYWQVRGMIGITAVSWSDEQHATIVALLARNLADSSRRVTDAAGAALAHVVAAFDPPPTHALLEALQQAADETVVGALAAVVDEVLRPRLTPGQRNDLRAALVAGLTMATSPAYDAYVLVDFGVPPGVGPIEALVAIYVDDTRDAAVRHAALISLAARDLTPFADQLRPRLLADFAAVLDATGEWPADGGLLVSRLGEIGLDEETSRWLGQRFVAAPPLPGARAGEALFRLAVEHAPATGAFLRRVALIASQPAWAGTAVRRLGREAPFADADAGTIDAVRASLLRALAARSGAAEDLAARLAAIVVAITPALAVVEIVVGADETVAGALARGLVSSIGAGAVPADELAAARGGRFDTLWPVVLRTGDPSDSPDGWLLAAVYQLIARLGDAADRAILEAHPPRAAGPGSPTQLAYDAALATLPTAAE